MGENRGGWRLEGKALKETRLCDNVGIGRRRGNRSSSRYVSGAGLLECNFMVMHDQICIIPHQNVEKCQTGLRATQSVVEMLGSGVLRSLSLGEMDNQLYLYERCTSA